MTLKKPVNFGNPDNDPVDIVLCICAKDKEDLNNNVIISAMMLFDSEETLEALRKASTEAELAAILDKVESAEE